MKGYGFKEKIRYDCIHRTDIYGLYVCAYTLLRQLRPGLGRNQTLVLAKKFSREGGWGARRSSELKRIASIIISNFLTSSLLLSRVSFIN